MGEQMATKESVLIAIVAAAGEAGLGRAQLQKSVFLVGEEFDGALPSNFYQFRPYMYGPFAQGVYADIERLSDGPMIHTYPGDDGRPIYRFASNAATEMIGLTDNLNSLIRRIVEWVTSMSFDELVRAIYYLYPEQRENSVFQGYSDERALEESFQRGFASSSSIPKP